MAFMDAVKDLAALAGMDVPAPSPQAQQREAQVTTAAAVLDRAAAWYHQQLRADDQVKAMLAEPRHHAGVDRQVPAGLRAAEKGRRGMRRRPEALAPPGC
jgi:DNA primase